MCPKYLRSLYINYSKNKNDVKIFTKSLIKYETNNIYKIIVEILNIKIKFSLHISLNGSRECYNIATEKVRQ